MHDLAAFLKEKEVRQAISLFQQMANNGLTLRDYGPAERLLLDNNLGDEFARPDVETLCDLEFLRPERAENGGKVFTEFKLTDKADRLVKEIKNRETEEADLRLRGRQVLRLWIVVVNESIFIDFGIAPPNLGRLVGEEWNPGDRISITCHDPGYVFIRYLPLALARGDTLFIADSHEVTDDFKYADAEAEA